MSKSNVRESVRWYLAAVAAVGMTCFAVGTAAASNPTLSSISPTGGQRGTDVKVTLRGARLADAEELLLYYPGIEVKDFKVEKDDTVTATFALGDDIRLGIHAFRLRTASGLTELRQFFVGALPEVAEKEPNTAFDQAQPIDLDTTVTGVITAEDVDHFSVEARRGERLTIELEGLRLGRFFFDPYLALLDANGEVVAEADDTPLLRQDAAISLLAPADGRYVVRLREVAYGGRSTCDYRLHIGRFPRPTATLPLGGRYGEEVDLTWLGDAAGRRVEKVRLPDDAVRQFGLFAMDEQGIAPSPTFFRLSDLGGSVEREPNNTGPTATPIQVPGAVDGVIAEPGDVDTFRFTAKKGQRYDINVYARQLRSPLDSVLTVSRIGGAGVGSNDDSGGTPDSYYRFTAPADDDYTVTIKDQLSRGGDDFAYRVEVTAVEPQVVLGLPERVRYADVTVAVPQGNRAAFLVSTARSDFNGPVSLDFGSLPRGVVAVARDVPAGQNVVPVVVEAAADAPKAGALVDVLGRNSGEGGEITSRFEQRTLLVRGQNQRRMWEHVSDRMAMAVAKAAPFAIEVVEPKVPIVRSGSMALKVVAERREGFDGEIAVSMLYNPPGIGSSRSIRIKPGESEAVIPLTASRSATVGEFSIAVVGQATVGDGPIETSSQLAALEVAEPFVEFAFARAAVEQGADTEVVVDVTHKRPFDGTARVELVGLPYQATSEPVEMTAETERLVFHVHTTDNTTVGRHRTLLGRAVLVAQGEPITHTLGTGELRVDRPVAASAASQSSGGKPLSRLEQLRLQRKQAIAAANDEASGTK